MTVAAVREDVLAVFSAYVEYRSTMLRSLKLPELTYIWAIHGSHPLPVRAGFCLEKGTAPSETKREEVFGFAFACLPEEIQLTCLLDYVGDVASLKAHLSKTAATVELRTGRHYRERIAEAWEQVTDLMLKLEMI